MTRYAMQISGVLLFAPTVLSLAAPAMPTAVGHRAPALRMESPALDEEATSSPSRVAALIAVPLAWGTYGPAVKLAYALPHVPPAPVLQALFQAVSFGGLLLANALNAPRPAASESGQGAPFDWSTVRAGAELGLWLFLGQAVQVCLTTRAAMAAAAL